MKTILLLIIFVINFCNASERQIQQTFLPPCLPSITSDLLAVHAQLAPQTQPHRETHEQEVTQLMARIRSLEQALQNKETELASTKTTVIQHAAELEKLKESLHHVTYVSTHYKAKFEETEHLLDLATREIVEHQNNDDERNRQIALIISNCHKKLEEMKQRQRANNLID